MRSVIVVASLGSGQSEGLAAAVLGACINLCVWYHCEVGSGYCKKTKESIFHNYFTILHKCFYFKIMCRCGPLLVVFLMLNMVF